MATQREASFSSAWTLLGLVSLGVIVGQGHMRHMSTIVEACQNLVLDRCTSNLLYISLIYDLGVVPYGGFNYRFCSALKTCFFLSPAVFHTQDASKCLIYEVEAACV